MVLLAKGMPLEGTTTTDDPGTDVEVLNSEVLDALSKSTTQKITPTTLKTTPEIPTTTPKVVPRNLIEPTQQVTPTTIMKNGTPWSPKETAYLEPRKSMDNVVTMMKLMENDREHSKNFKEWHEKWEALWKEGKKYLPWGPYGPWGENDFDYWYKYNCPPYYGKWHVWVAN